MCLCTPFDKKVGLHRVVHGMTVGPWHTCRSREVVHGVTAGSVDGPGTPVGNERWCIW